MEHDDKGSSDPGFTLDVEDPVARVEELKLPAAGGERIFNGNVRPLFKLT
jgi:hypothetical protein